uniref:Glucoside xylosyltransferase 1b n=1 Tax=Cyprinus carpio TaxID=7962 RepID=A0A8C1JDV0_CYPCA
MRTIALLSLVFLFSKHDAESFSVGFKAPLEPSVVILFKADVCLAEFTDVAQKVNSPGQREPLMQLAVVACGERHREAVNMLKTAAMLSSRALRFHIFAEKQLHTNIQTAVSMTFIRAKFSYVIQPISFPHENHEEWSQLFKPCASLPMILKEVDSLLYVDTEVLLLQPLVAMTLEHKKPQIAWYSRFSRHPYYGKTAINSGVMLMNLTRMRITQFKNDMTSIGLHWDGHLMPLLQKYKLNIIWGDQDLINCTINSDHCIYGSNCVPAEEEGVFMLHGNRGVLHSDKPPAFKAVYDAFKHYTFGEDLIKSFLLPLEEALNETTHTYCGKVSHFLTRGLGKSVRKLQRMTPAGG